MRPSRSSLAVLTPLLAPQEIPPDRLLWRLPDDRRHDPRSPPAQLGRNEFRLGLGPGTRLLALGTASLCPPVYLGVEVRQDPHRSSCVDFAHSVRPRLTSSPPLRFHLQEPHRQRRVCNDPHCGNGDSNSTVLPVSSTPRSPQTISLMPIRAARNIFRSCEEIPPSGAVSSFFLSCSWSPQWSLFPARSSRERARCVAQDLAVGRLADPISIHSTSRPSSLDTLSGPSDSGFCQCWTRRRRRRSS